MIALRELGGLLSSLSGTLASVDSSPNVVTWVILSDATGARHERLYIQARIGDRAFVSLRPEPQRLLLAILAGWVVVFATDFLFMTLDETGLCGDKIALAPGIRHAHLVLLDIGRAISDRHHFRDCLGEGLRGGSMGAAVPSACSWACFSKPGPSFCLLSCPCRPIRDRVVPRGLVQAVLLGIVTSRVFKPAAAAASIMQDRPLRSPDHLVRRLANRREAPSSKSQTPNPKEFPSTEIPKIWTSPLGI